MRFYLFIIVLYFRLCSPGLSYAQINLVPNPSFEDTVYCPFGTNQIDACADWLNFGNSPDYFNACNPFGMSVPNSVFGFQYAHTGVAMAGLATYRRPNTPAGPNYREFMGIQLSTPLLIGQKYFFSFHTNFSFTLGIATNNIGMRFSTVANDSCCLPILNNFAHLFTDLILSDSVDWVRLSGSFIADSNYNFISIGNFFQDNQTDTLNVIVNPNPDAAYYYIDDVCVSTDSTYNQTWTSVAQLDPSKAVEVYPNPFTQNFYLKSKVFYNEIKIYDLAGRVIHYIMNDLGNSVTQIDINNGAGLYIMKVTTKNKTTINYKLLKN